MTLLIFLALSSLRGFLADCPRPPALLHDVHMTSCALQQPHCPPEAWRDCKRRQHLLLRKLVPARELLSAWARVQRWLKTVPGSLSKQAGVGLLGRGLTSSGERNVNPPDVPMRCRGTCQRTSTEGTSSAFVKLYWRWGERSPQCCGSRKVPLMFPLFSPRSLKCLERSSYQLVWNIQRTEIGSTALQRFNQQHPTCKKPSTRQLTWFLQQILMNESRGGQEADQPVAAGSSLSFVHYLTPPH